MLCWFVCVCVCACVSACVCLFVCVWLTGDGGMIEVRGEGQGPSLFMRIVSGGRRPQRQGCTREERGGGGWLHRGTSCPAHAVRVSWQDVGQPSRGKSRALAAVYAFQRHARAAASIRLRSAGNGEDVLASVRVVMAQALNGHVV